MVFENGVLFLSGERKRTKKKAKAGEILSPRDILKRIYRKRDGRTSSVSQGVLSVIKPLNLLFQKFSVGLNVYKIQNYEDHCNIVEQGAHDDEPNAAAAFHRRVGVGLDVV